jgi:hypothetical protein
MEKHFMLDIEATGISPATEELLSVGILEANWSEKGGYWIPGRAKEWFCHTDRKPESSFAKEHMVELFAKCNAAPELTVERLRWEILDFLRQCGTTGVEDTYFMGWNASNFDLPFLIAKGVLFPNHYEPGPDGKDRMVGDFHYRIYEMGGAVSLAQDVTKARDRAVLIERAREAAPIMEVYPGKKHDALYDCYEQLRLLNGLSELCRRL